MAAMLLGSSGLFAVESTAYTKPSGFVTHTLKAGKFNLIGLTLHEAVTVAGTFTDINGSVLTDANAAYNAALEGGKTYVLEVTSGTLDGTIQEVTVWTDNTITTPDDLSGGLQDGDSYQLRAAMTVADVFGDANEGGLLGGASASVSDNIYIPTASGFEIYYYSTGGFFGTGWRKDGGGATDYAGHPMVMTDAFYLYRRGTEDLNLVHTGTVKVVDTSSAITSKYSYLSGVYPVGSTLDSSDLKDSLVGGASASVSDQVLIQNDAGGFDFYYYSTGGFFGTGWRKDGAGNTPQESVALPSAFIIQRVGTQDFNLKLSKPAGYENL